MSALQISRLPIQIQYRSLPFPSAPSRFKKPYSRPRFKTLASKSRVSISRSGSLIVPRSSSEDASSSVVESDRPPFDLNLAVVLAGFAFEAYSSPPEDIGWSEMDGAECRTVFLSELFLREVYDGQIFIKLKKGVNFPALDPWGTSDPYVILQLDGQVVKSKVKWATKDPVWNEDFTLNIKISRTNILQVAAWDANLVTPHKRMGNAGLNLESLCDGNIHEIMLELEGIGGGGKIYLEVKYKSYDEINREKNWWTIPFVSDILMKSSLGSALKLVLGSESVNVSDFVQSAFGQLKPFYSYLQTLPASDSDEEYRTGSDKSLKTDINPETLLQEDRSSQRSVDNPGLELQDSLSVIRHDALEGNPSLLNKQSNEPMPSDAYFWKTFADSINQSVLKKLGVSLPEIKLWEGFDSLNKMSTQSQKIAEEEYIQSGLATPMANQETNDEEAASNLGSLNAALSSIMDLRKISWDVLNQTEAVLGALMVLTPNVSQLKKDSNLVVENDNGNDATLAKEEDVTGQPSDISGKITVGVLSSDVSKEEEMKKIFSSAESAMEAWAMLATSLGRNSFIKSEFEKICFLDNVSTDTQVAIWRDTKRRRLIVAFRGTEQVKWKDLRTDLMLLPAGLNPERLGSDFKEEVQVHSGFLNAYDSVRNRIMALIKLSIGYSEDNLGSILKWHVYITGHSLGGALATLLALELSSTRMAKCNIRCILMFW
ncbi:uncharacterized protein LOC109826104 isoform X2 [Asparagus officinalis]|uniref:uncharacterized protein LOC109826104 isoform X2 n=1 Tax=Asparagus officinalis TaxID=4686 RepID=UPI00098E0D8F|nr:uncharacterized protein LOC109826104 isoform X2 [Asparagus officinalis]